MKYALKHYGAQLCYLLTENAELYLLDNVGQFELVYNVTLHRSDATRILALDHIHLILT